MILAKVPPPPPGMNTTTKWLTVTAGVYILLFRIQNQFIRSLQLIISFVWPLTYFAIPKQIIWYSRSHYLDTSGAPKMSWLRSCPNQQGLFTQSITGIVPGTACQLSENLFEMNYDSQASTLYFILHWKRTWCHNASLHAPQCFNCIFFFLVHWQWAIPEIRGTPLKKTNIF